VDLVAEHLRDQLTHLVLRERLHLEALGQPVLPERRDRIWCRIAGSGGGEDEDAGVGGKLMREGGRGLVEQVGIVDADHKTAPSSALKSSSAMRDKRCSLLVVRGRLTRRR